MSQRIHIDAKADYLLGVAKRHDPVGAVAELIWNGLDAEASVVEVTFVRNLSEGIEGVSVRDNGHGMPHASCESYFGNLGGSWKATAKVSSNLNRTLNGKNGQGRIRGFALGERVRWETVSDSLTERERTIVSGSSSHPADFEIDGPHTGDDKVGTVFTSGQTSERVQRLSTPAARTALTAEFAPFLIHHPDVTIVFDGKALDPDHALIASWEYELDATLGQESGTPSVRVIEWHKVPSRELNLCDASGVTLAPVPPGIHAAGHQFTAYVLWDGFRDHVDYLALADLEGDAVGPIVEAARDVLREHFRLRDVEKRREQVAKWKQEQVYPYEAEPRTAPETAERDTFDFVATTVARHIPTPAKSKRATLRLLRELVANEPSGVLPVLDDLYHLTKADKDSLARLLDRTPLSHLITSSTEVANRLDFLAALKLMVFDPKHNKKVKERKELHRILENETWIFGEQFDLLVSDQSLDAVLSRHLKELGRKTTDLTPVRREDGRQGIVDLMLGRAQRASQRREHLVVELKRPTQKIGQKEVGQLKSYAQAVSSDSQFVKSVVQWDFWIIGNTMDDSVRNDANQANRPAGLLVEWPNARLWAKTWSEIVDDCEVRLHYYTESLSHDPSSTHATEYLNRIYEAITPTTLRLKPKSA